MREMKRTILIGLLLSTALNLTKAQQQPEVFLLRAEDLTTMIAKRGILSGTEKEDAPCHRLPVQ